MSFKPILDLILFSDLNLETHLLELQRLQHKNLSLTDAVSKGTSVKCEINFIASAIRGGKKAMFKNSTWQLL